MKQVWKSGPRSGPNHVYPKKYRFALPPGSYHGWTLANEHTTAAVEKQPPGHTNDLLGAPLDCQ